MFVQALRAGAVRVTPDNDIRFSKSADSPLNFAQESVIFGHNYALSHRKLHGFEADNDLILLFVHFGLPGFEIVLDAAQFLIELFFGQ